MNSRIFLLHFAVIVILTLWPFYTYAQRKAEDSQKTLQWVEAQSNRIEGLLKNAMREAEPFDIVNRLSDSYQAFNAVALAGLQCDQVRAIAELGRRHSDVLNYRLGKDLNSVLQRTVEARQQAVRMGQAARACQAENAQRELELSEFTPNDIMRYDAQLAELDLSDGLATTDMRILTQKLEHAIILLLDVDHLASTMSNCDTSIRLAGTAVAHCQAALAATNWPDIYQSVVLAIADVQAIQQSGNCN